MCSVSMLLLLSASISISTPVAAQANDEAALLTFKAAAISSGSRSDALASWNGSTSGFCSWEGVRCGGKHRRVVSLSLPSQGLTGVLSPAVGNLSSLRFLNLSSNCFISGDIPASLARLHHLNVLDLSNNAFSGEVPANLSSCTNLVFMALRSNQLSGRVPPEFGDKLTRLKVVDLWNNSLTGVIPVSLGNLSSLTVLALAINHLEGTIPPGLGGIVGLQWLTLAENNLSGEPPRSLYNLSSLEWLDHRGNMLHGSIPTDIGIKFPNMQFLSFATNQFTGSIPASLSNLTSLQILYLERNRLNGCVPPQLGMLPALQTLYLHNNMLRANKKEGWEFITSLSNCSQLEQLIMHSNVAFTGQMPNSIGNLSKTMKMLSFGSSGISGSLPSDIGNLVNLRMLSAANTSISGEIPESIGKLGNLGWLSLHNTRFSGLIPSSIGNLSQLTKLYANNGNLEGAIPSSLGKLKSLSLLDLSRNHLNGSIPKEIFELPVLSIYLALSYNSLSGPLPSEVGSLRNLNSLYLSGNLLSGEIPENIGGCTVLQQLLLDSNSFQGSIPHTLNNVKGLNALNLSMNRLSGTIPDAIASIHNLQVLCLSHNNLTGPIPGLLQNLTSLLELDLSFNKLQGEVPTEGIFRYLANLSLTGNNKLCGGIPELHLAPCHMNSTKNGTKGWFRIIMIALGATSALLFLALGMAHIQFIYKKLTRKQKRRILPLVVEKEYEKVSYHMLANGTNGFSEANLLGKGSFGVVYKCTFYDEETIAAVKVFNLQQSGSARSFVAECETLRRIRHHCLVKVITCCSSIDHLGQEFKALIFEFMPNGSLNAWLHPTSGMPDLTNTLSLEQRLDIAVDVMDALDYLHNHCQTPIVHCDLKPSNILLAEDMSARVGDFGISRILPESACRTLQNSNSTTGIRGSIGYVAPEYGEGSAVSTIGDVYSLGILLLEMFTGRNPTDDMFREVDLHQYSKQALSERILDITDSTIWLHEESKAIIIRGRIKNCLASVFRLAISCSERNPRDRMMMRDAVVEMHTIRDSYHKFSC
ncbi:unnamed protein product [Urochloa decumbens]|uniref:Receptor kinase-like protein Xa21 n=1 Tax=Urochloa decumbens TaxID=240449 RepID=A0ABC8ZQ60_9POAL